MGSILVMGGTSFVSGSFARYLIGQGYEVDILTRGVKSIDYEGYREHLVCDRKSKTKVHEVLKGGKYEFIFDISAYRKEDVEILLTSIDTSNLKKYIFCSSGAVYKPCENMISEGVETGENYNWGQYGLDKIEAEEYIVNSGIPYLIFRPTYIYGENNNLYRESYFFERILESKPIPIPNGNFTRTQFIHIDDLVRVFESAMYNSNTNEIYNVTNSEIVTWENLIIACGAVVGKAPILKKIDTSKVKLESREYFPFRDVTYMLDIDKLMKDEFYIPSISLYEGLRKTYLWYLENRPNLRDSRMDKVDLV